MKMIACVDDKGGMMFNSRRQSRDRVLCDKILEMTAGRKLWVSPYTAGQFTDGTSLHITESFKTDAEAEDYCFVEDADVAALLPMTRQVILFYWNRTYPADKFFPTELLKEMFVCSEKQEFRGSSHERIRMEVYIRS